MSMFLALIGIAYVLVEATGIFDSEPEPPQQPHGMHVAHWTDGNPSHFSNR